jgi:uncharacterized membrane protein YdjX (TVP38/TMEM64 family)
MDRSGRKGAFFTLLGLFALGALVLMVPPLREAVANVLSGDAADLRRELLDLGPAGALVLVALMLVHAVVPFPSELVNAAAGFVYGFWIAFPLALFGWLLAARLVPIVTYSAVGYVAGVAHVPLWRFAWTTLAGSAPLCAAVVYLGNRLDSLSPTDPGLLVAVGSFLVLLVGGRVLAQRVRRREPA